MMIKISDSGVVRDLNNHRALISNKPFFFPGDFHERPSNGFLNYDVENCDTFGNCRRNLARERKKFAKRKKVIKRERIKLTETRDFAVGQGSCCCKNKLDCYGNKRNFVDSRNCIMSQETEIRVDDQIAAANLSEKRKAWRNSSTTAAASERDSLLTNSGDDRLSASFDSRQEQKQPRDSNRSPGEAQYADNSNLLRVPSPARRSGFYSTTPSTDEGIGTDDHLPEESYGKSSFDQNHAKEDKVEKQNDEKTNRSLTKEGKKHFHERSLSVHSTPMRSSQHLNTKLYHDVDSNDSRWIPLPRPHLADVRKPSSFQEDVYYASPRLCRGCGYLQPPNYHAPHFYSTGNVNSSGQPFLIRNEAYTVSNEERAHRKRQSYKRSGSSRVNEMQYLEPYFESCRATPQPLRRHKQQICRQASEQFSNRSPRYSRRESWTSVASCCELNQRDTQTQDGPILLFNRIPGETHSCEAKLPTLIERRESEVVTRNGIPISRIVSKSVEESNTGSKSGKSSLKNTHSNSPLDINSNETLLQLETNKENSPTKKLKNLTTHTDANNNASIPEQKSQPIPKSHSGSIKGSLKKTEDTTQKTRSRTGSTRSAIAGALSSSVVATATGSVMTVSNPITPKDKQRSLTERLLSVGPSNPRRVQGIVQDILCEMGEKRLIQYKDAFAKYDKNRNGIISSKQLRTLLRTLGHNPSDTELRELVNQVDMDENGKIDFKEFIIMIAYFDKANNEDEDLMDIFRVFDQEGKGCINVNELRNVWNNYLMDDIPSQEFEEMINVVDVDGDGEINRLELLKLLSAR